MFSENCILLIKQGVNVTENMQQLYCDNLRLLHTICTSLGLSRDERDEFMQLAYLALADAVKVYVPDGKYSFLSYYRQCLRHQYFVYRLEMKYPMRVNQNTYRNTQYSTVLPLDVAVREANSDLDFIMAEDKLLAETVWNEVYAILTEENADIVFSYYGKGETYQTIGNRYGIGLNSVRKRVLRSLRLLRYSEQLRGIASDYYGIEVV